MLRLMCAVLLLFQSTLPREERPDEFKSYIENEHFNPRSHERSDYFTPNKNRLTHVYFNPRSHERSDHCSLYHLSVLQLFQSTLPREERHVRRGKYSLLWQISIHAPTRGATVNIHLLMYINAISIHAPTRGATLAQQRPSPTPLYFNPRSHERSDLSEVI